MLRIVIAASFILLIAACGDSAIGTDGGPAADARRFDASLPTDAPSGPLDGSTADATTVDAGSQNLGPIDCQSDTDCPGDITCNQSPPGGICLGCGLTECDVEFTCFVGACVRDCNTNDDCNIGKRCTSAGRCAIRNCSDVSPCPAPYVCSGNLCARPSCESALCPEGMTCDTGSNLCME